jgi:predicted metalloprotease
VQVTAEETTRRKLVSVVLAETEDAWNAIFAANGARYEEPTLVLFRDEVQSACGFAQSAAGPFYCPADRKLFLDLGFFDDMATKLGADGDFAMAYVVAHEVAHHVQTLLGVSGKVNRLRQQAGEAESNALSVKLELQADCLAGIWANRAQRQAQLLEAGDIEEALNAAAAVGDDRLQKRAQGYVVPESFTHGTSAERVEWFRKGLQAGDLGSCDTFAGRM